MEITWYGQSCFKLTERGSAVVITDPYDFRNSGRQPLKFSADIVTLSHGESEASLLEIVQGKPYVITGAGEYEVGSVFVTGIQTGWSKSGEENRSARNTVYVFDFDSLTIAHLGNLDHVPAQADIEAIGTVKIALVPVGSGYGLSPSKAAEVISLLEPNIVIPMYSSEDPAQIEALHKFLKEMGASMSEGEGQPSLKVSNTALPEETKLILLSHQ